LGSGLVGDVVAQLGIRWFILGCGGSVLGYLMAQLAGMWWVSSRGFDGSVGRNVVAKKGMVVHFGQWLSW
jgi:hypothetical protein